MGDTPDKLTCPTCGNVFAPTTDHPSSQEDGYMLNNAERISAEKIVLMVQCEECNDIFKPVFSYVGNEK